MKIGLIVSLSDHPLQDFNTVREYGFDSCQLNSWQVQRFTPQTAEAVRKAASETGVEISALWCGWPGPAVWDFVQGPLTLGIVPPTYREERMEALLKGAEFAAQIGTRDLVTHVGFIPEDLNLPLYSDVVAALSRLARRCQELGLRFLFETGQETPVTLLRTIEDIGLDNVGVNLDPANLILYGKGNPIDALDVIGKYVWGVHAKDGFYPTTGRKLGVEVALGEGKVNVPLLISRLRDLGYTGSLTIEREISGAEQARDIVRARDLLRKLIDAA